MEQENNTVHGIAYGKLYLAGEYAILEDNSEAILTTVDKKITATIKKSNKTIIFDNFYNVAFTLEDTNKNYELVQKLITFIRSYTKDYRNFELTIYNELHSNNKKYGLGSSGAILVAITKAMLEFSNISYDNLKVFKIVTLFGVLNDIHGSMGDVAACYNLGLTYYKKFETAFLKKMIKEKTIEEVIDSSWRGLIIEKLEAKIKIKILAHWTGEAVDTKEHVKLWKEKKSSVKEKYSNFVATSNNLVGQLKSCITKGENKLFLLTINKLRENLLFLESFSGIPMETPAMKKYIDKYPAGKQSGSGSGDIVLAFKEQDKPFEINLNLTKLED